ncbi:MAG: carboxypeptidase-like regulatory domain-containing protein, partial [bacterium]
MTRGCLSKFALTACLILLFSLVAWGQVAGTAAVTGTVTDPTGAVIPGAEVTVSSEQYGVTRTAKTDAAGKFLITQVRPGIYKVEIHAAGFKTLIQQRIDLLVGTTTNLEFQLEVGALAETVTVEAGGVTLNTSDASLGTPFSADEVKNLPSLDRNPAALLSLQTGVTYVPGGVEPGGYGGQDASEHRSGSVSGARSDQTNVTLDGVDVNDPQTGSAFTSVLR